MTPAPYFAYGSNLHPERLRARTPSAAPLGTAALAGYALRFHKRGRDGSGKCDAVPTRRQADVVLGALYRLALEDVAMLHEIEGVGQGYAVRTVRVRAGTRLVTAFTYRAEPAWIDPRLQPWDWYKALVLAGARHHGFPEAYLRTLAAVPSRPDPDRERSALHAALLDRIGAAPSRS